MHAFPNRTPQRLWLGYCLAFSPRSMCRKALGRGYFLGSAMSTAVPAEPLVKRAVAFFDGQNLFHAAKEAFGHRFPNYDPPALAKRICQERGWQLVQTLFYTATRTQPRVPAGIISGPPIWQRWAARASESSRGHSATARNRWIAREESHSLWLRARFPVRAGRPSATASAKRRGWMFVSRSTSFAWPTSRHTMSAAFSARTRTSRKWRTKSGPSHACRHVGSSSPAHSPTRPPAVIAGELIERTGSGSTSPPTTPASTLVTTG